LDDNEGQPQRIAAGPRAMPLLQQRIAAGPRADKSRLGRGRSRPAHRRCRLAAASCLSCDGRPAV